MKMSVEEARASLSEIDQVMESTDRSAVGDRAFPYLILWGIIWTVVPLWVHLKVGTAYMPFLLFPIGGVITAWLGVRSSQPIKNKETRRTGLIWWGLFLAFGVLAFIAKPSSMEARYAFGCIAAMVVYIVFGLQGAPFFAALGTGVILLTVAGLFLCTPIFWIWMAVTGGGALLGAAFYLKYRRG